MDEKIRKAERKGDYRAAIHQRLRKGFPFIEMIRQTIRFERIAQRMQTSWLSGTGPFAAVNGISPLKPITDEDILKWLRDFQDVTPEEAHNRGLRRVMSDFICGSGCACATSPGSYGGLCETCGRQARYEVDDYGVNPTQFFTAINPMQQIPVVAQFFADCYHDILTEGPGPEHMAQRLTDTFDAPIIEFLIQDNITAEMMLGQLEPLITNINGVQQFQVLQNNLLWFDNMLAELRQIAA